MPTARAPRSTASKRSGTRGPANNQALLAAAHRLVLERGEDFTTQDLVKEADVALQTFYRHFGSKDQLLLAVVADLVNAHCETLAAKGAELDGPLERLQFYVTDILTLFAGDDASTNESNVVGGARFMTSQHWRLHQTLPDALAEANKPFADLVEREIVAGVEAGLLTSPDPARDAWIITKLVMTAFHHYAFAADDPSAATSGEDIWRFCRAALGAGADKPTGRRCTGRRS